jgi:ubiquinone/menaquinone biosynthesis C-methylase UbiE
MKTLFIIFLLLLNLSLFAQCSSANSRQEHFNKLAGSPEWQPDRVIDSLKIQKGWIIGDLGAGGGYYTYRFSAETGMDGKVYAADINQEFLKKIEDEAVKKNLKNVYTILAEVDDSGFENNSMDLIFIRNTFHHFEDKNLYMKKLSLKLKDNGRIAIIDYKKDGVFRIFGHNVEREEILEAMDGSGLIPDKEYDFLESQYFFIFKKN